MAVVFALYYVINLWALHRAEQLSVREVVIISVCVAGILSLFVCLNRFALQQRERRAVAALLPVALLVAGALLAGTVLFYSERGGIGDLAAIIWLAMAVLHVPRIAGALLFIGVVVASLFAVVPPQLDLYEETTGKQASNGDVAEVYLIATFQLVWWSMALAGLMLGWRATWRLTKETYDQQEAMAKLAVSEERLRFSRDLHDLLGHSLSVIALKSELAAKLTGRAPEKASAEVSEVRDLARGALKEVRAAVRGYRALDLEEELASVRGVLEAAGVRCMIEADTDSLSAEKRSLLAWVVREGATNILKHSSATRCLITIRSGVLEIRNDGVRYAPDGSGTGLAGLSERIGAAGGTFSAAPLGNGEFRMRAVLAG